MVLYLMRLRLGDKTLKIPFEHQRLIINIQKFNLTHEKGG